MGVLELPRSEWEERIQVPCGREENTTCGPARKRCGACEVVRDQVDRERRVLGGEER